MRKSGITKDIEKIRRMEWEFHTPCECVWGDNMERSYCAKIDEAIAHMQFTGTLLKKKSLSTGHINDTFEVAFRQKDGGKRRYILQRINHHVFHEPEAVMKNIWGVTQHLRKKILEEGGDLSREMLNVIPSVDNKCYYKDSNGYMWRAFDFIEDSVCLDTVEEPNQFYQSAVAFGKFQKMLSDYPAEELYETIPDFHNTPMRLKNLKKAVEENKSGRAGLVQEEYQFIMAREKELAILQNLLEKGELPLRVTHNDTKLNNVMLDADTGEGLCVLDLDTVMPGLAVTDFGDAIRFGASTAEEDERDLSKVWIDLTLFEAYTKGYLETCGNSLTPTEIEMLPLGAKTMTLECASRFLADYIDGDIYFRTEYPDHNLVRCHTQMKLAADMERKWPQMIEIVDKYNNKN